MDSINDFTICSSPVKQLSPIQKDLIRSKIIKEIPQRFYSNQNIFNKQLNVLTNSYSIDNNNTIHKNYHDKFKYNKNIYHNTHRKNTTNHNDQNASIFIENPILNKFINKSINKEFEFHKLIINIISLFIITLFIKIFKLVYHIFNNHNISNNIFFYHFNYNTTNNNNLNTLNFYLIKLIKLFQMLFNNIDNIKYLINSIVSFNIMVSLIKLLSYSKTSSNDRNSSNNYNNYNISNTSNIKSYNLSDRQKDLLGLNQNEVCNNYKNSNQSLMKKLYEVQLNNNLLPSHDNNKINRVTEDSESHGNNLVPKTPYIFKSLKTPLKKDLQLQFQQDNKFIQSTFSSHLKDITNSTFNATNTNTTTTNNSNNLNIFTTMETPTLSNNKKIGYIPSNKYAYLMDSPSSIKKNYR